MQLRHIKKVLASCCILLLASSNLVSGVNASDTTNEVSSKTVSEKRDLGKYLVQLVDDIDVEEFTKKKGLHNGKSKKIKSNTISVKLDPSEVQKLKNDPEVTLIEDDSNVSISSEPDTSSSNQITPWGIHSIGADLIKDSTPGENIKIAVLDTGISQHPDLNIAGGMSFVEGASTYTDDNGHGTHVAGIISALNNDLGVVGVAPHTSIYASKILDQSGLGSYSQVIQGLEWAIQNNINIVCMSFGGTEDSEILHETIKEASEKGIILVAAAGNNGMGAETELYPALYPEVVSVGAVTKSHQRATFSSTGKEIDIVAPGTDILSTTLNNGYESLSGTSMAAPYVVGAAAVLWSSNQTYAAKEIVDELFKTATPLGEESEYGHGLVNVAKALGITDSPIDPIEDEEEEEVEIPEDNVTSSKFNNFNQKDALFLSYSKKLLDLKEKAKLNNDTPLAKKIDQEYNSLLQNSIDLHQLPVSINSLSKSKSVTQAVYDHYQMLDKDFEKLQTYYVSAIETFSGQISVQKSDTDVQRMDTYEPNNETGFAHKVPVDGSYTSNISYAGDVDFFTFTPEKTGFMVIGLSVPTDKDYDFYFYDKTGNIIGSGNTGATGTSESVGVNVTAFNSYYVKIFSNSNEYSDSAIYSLLLTNVFTDYQKLFINDPIDVNSEGSIIREFTPDKSANYKIFTGPYGGYGAANDTILEIYSDAALTQLVARNDDSNGTVFSEIKTSLISGYKYYIKLKNYYTGQPVYARITAQLDNPSVSTIQLNSPIDVSAYAGESRILKFTPPSWGGYTIFTDYFGGSNSGSQANDTVLFAYLDPNLTQQIAYNDDYNEKVFSQLLISSANELYIKVAGYNGGPVNARVTVIPSDFTTQSLAIDNPVDIKKPAGNQAFFTFTPNESGSYRFYTSSYQNSGEPNDTVLYLYDNATGHKLAFNDDLSDYNQFSKIEYSLEAGKTYRVVLRHYSQWEELNTRLSAVKVSNNDIGNDIASAYSISTGYISNSFIEYPGDVDVYRFQPESNGVYSFETNATTGDMDTVVELYDQKQVLLNYGDDYQGAVTSNVTNELYSGQIYYLKVFHYDENGIGAYSIHMTQIDDNVNGDAISVNASLTRMINYASDEDVFMFTPTETRSYVIRTTGSTDTVGTLIDSSNDPFADNDDAADLNFSISSTLTANQTYYVRVRAYNPILSNASYTLIVQ